MKALDRLIEILQSVRDHKTMYFNPVEPVPAIYWLAGLRTGVSLAGLKWSPDHRRRAVERRGLTFRASWEDEELRTRGIAPEAIVDELLSIEIEMWQLQRDDAPE